MACNQTISGLAKDCAPSKGGVKRVLLINADEVTAVTETSSKITAITLASNKKFFEYTFRPNTASMSSNYTIDPANGVNYVATDLVMVFMRMDTTKRIEISALAQNELVALVQDCNGTWWFLGKDNPVYATAGDGLTGTNKSDRNGYSITLHDDSDEMPTEVLVGTGGVNIETLLGS